VRVVRTGNNVVQGYLLLSNVPKLLSRLLSQIPYSSRSWTRPEEAGYTGSNDTGVEAPLRVQLVLVPSRVTRHKLDRLGNSGRLLILGLELEEYLSSLCASKHDKMLAFGRLET
jgi:hypothetical protein